MSNGYNIINLILDLCNNITIKCYMYIEIVLFILYIYSYNGRTTYHSYHFKKQS